MATAAAGSPTAAAAGAPFAVPCESAGPALLLHPAAANAAAVSSIAKRRIAHPQRSRLQTAGHPVELEEIRKAQLALT